MWLAGLLEGDGHFRHPGVIVLAMKDLETVQRAARVIGHKRLPYVRTRRGNQEPVYYMQACGNDARWAMLQVYPWMSSRRRTQIEGALHRTKDRRGQHARKFTFEQAIQIRADTITSGKSRTEIARELGVVRQTVGNIPRVYLGVTP